MRHKAEWNLHVCALYQEGLNVAALEGNTFKQGSEKLHKF